MAVSTMDCLVLNLLIMQLLEINYYLITQVRKCVAKRPFHSWISIMLTSKSLLHQLDIRTCTAQIVQNLWCATVPWWLLMGHWLLQGSINPRAQWPGGHWILRHRKPFRTWWTIPSGSRCASVRWWQCPKYNLISATDCGRGFHKQTKYREYHLPAIVTG